MDRKFVRAQQEMVGFVLIVVLVVIGLMVFLVISANKDRGEPLSSLEASQLLDSLFKKTTGCAIVFEPEYDNFEELFKSCFDGATCSNLQKSACEYLNESLRTTLTGVLDSESTVEAYQLDFLVKDGEGILRIQEDIGLEEGTCTGEVTAAKKSLVSRRTSLSVQLTLCK